MRARRSADPFHYLRNLIVRNGLAVGPDQHLRAAALDEVLILRVLSEEVRRGLRLSFLKR